MRTNIIFKNDHLEVYYQNGKSPNDGEAKAIKVKCKAYNWFDGKVYEKHAGWISATLALHGGSRTPEYIYDAAIESIEKHKDEILAAIIDYLEAIGNNYRAEEFRKMNGLKAGSGVDFNTAHPRTEAQRQRVRLMMQANAPEGTNHL